MSWPSETPRVNTGGINLTARSSSAMRRESRPSPCSENNAASSAAVAPFTMSEAEPTAPSSIRMSKGPSCW